MSDKGLPKEFWAEAVHTSVYLFSRLPTKVVESKTPMCYVHVSVTKRTKLNQKAKLGLFLGYATTSKSYRIYNLKSNQVQVSKDVKVDEYTLWN